MEGAGEHGDLPREGGWAAREKKEVTGEGTEGYSSFFTVPFNGSVRET